MSKAAFKIFEKPPIEESYDYAEQVRRQIERCLEASAIQDDKLRVGTYRACILALGNLVPLDDRDKKFDTNLSACTVEKEEWEYKKFGGIKVGTPEEPIGDSPQLKTKKVTNWDEHFMVIFNKFVELGVTIRRGTHSG